MIEFAAGFVMGALALAGICSLFKVDGRDWGEQQSQEDDDSCDDLPPYLRKDYDPFSSRGNDRF